MRGPGLSLGNGLRVSAPTVSSTVQCWGNPAWGSQKLGCWHWEARSLGLPENPPWSPRTVPLCSGSAQTEEPPNHAPEKGGAPTTETDRRSRMGGFAERDF